MEHNRKMNLLNNHQLLQNKTKTSNYHWLNRWLRLLRKQPCLCVTQAFISLENQSTTGPPAPVIRWCLQIFSNISVDKSSCLHLVFTHKQVLILAPSSQPVASFLGKAFTIHMDVASWLLYLASYLRTNLCVKHDPLHASLAARRGKGEGGVEGKVGHHGSVFTAHLTP